MKRPIMIMAGGTGGHVFPALAVANYLNEQNIPLLWLGTEKGLEARVVPEAGYRLLTLGISGVRGKGFWALLRAPFRLLFALMQALKMMINHRPAVVLGMGGFASGPGGIAAWLMRIPLLIHEQNAIAGMTNRWLSKVATQVFEAFPGTFAAQLAAKHVGNPIRQSIVKLSKQKMVEKPLKILIVGGSLGALKLNQVIPAALSKLSKKPQIWHQTGQNDLEATKVRYKEQRIDARVEPFLEQIEQAYGWANLVICRAGALTVSELAVAGLPSILVPYPYAVDDHQTANAHYLADAGAAVIIDDSELSEEKLTTLIDNWIAQPERLQTMSIKASGKAMSGATEQVAQMIMQVAYDH